MKKNVIHYTFLLFFLGILLPQLFLQEYLLIVLTWVSLGVLAGAKQWFQKIFSTAFLLELPIVLALFFLGTNGYNKNFLFQFVEANELPAFLLPVALVLFNCLNVAICVTLGYTLGKWMNSGGRFASDATIDLERGLPEKVSFFNLFQTESKLFFPFLALVGMINGLWASALLILVNNKITGTPLPFFDEYDWLIYIILIVVSFIIAASFQSFMIKLTHRFGAEMRLSIFNKLRFTQYQDWMKLGEEQLRTALTDVSSLQQFPNFFLDGFNAFVLVVIGIGYLFYADAWGAGIILAIMLLLTGVYLYRNRQIKKDLDEARSLLDVYHGYVIDFVRGFKELKMSVTASDRIFKDYLKVNQVDFLNHQIRALIRNLANKLMGSYAWYIMIGVVLFILPAYFDISLKVAASFLVTLLFLMGPVNTLIGMMEYFIRTKVAIDRLNQYNELVSSSTQIEKGHGDLTNINEKFESIRFENVTFEYFDENKESRFKLQPIDLTLRKGEIVFVTGGNGSGKSTFINLLTGLYQPRSGGVYLNGKHITGDNLAFYRDQLSCIFTDNYLFSENYENLQLGRSDKSFNDLLEKMKLQEVAIYNGDDKVSHALSKGQQKRMALIYAILKNREVFVFDEWAAEQDPEFRKYFYQDILPELKNMGKTVVAVTHDDAYFDCADRILKFDFGRIVKDEKIHSPFDKVLRPKVGQLLEK